ncbi:MAG: protein O-GlcNAcase [Candidatus Binatia bacterium]
MSHWALLLASSLVVAAAGAAGARVPPMRGVIEGYYGRPWTGEARRDVIRFLAAHGLDTFVYAPKNDPWHRDRWREPYPADALADLRETAHLARTLDVRFLYALSPALDVCYACDDDFAALTAKLAQLSHAGVRRFALLFDDAPEQLERPEDVARFGGADGAALARAHADLANRTARWLRTHRLGTLRLVVPTDYAGDGCSAYNDQLGRALRRGMPIGWTGSGVFAPTITGAEAQARRRCLHGHPVVLWDNVPVNDTLLAINLHLGPLTGRSADLPGALGGYLLNPMTQAHASLITLGTAAAYLRRPARYDPEAAWRATLAELGGSGLAILAENTRSSALDLDDARPLAAALAAVQASYDGADWTAAVDGLAAEVARQAGAPALIAGELDGTPLGAEIAPWVAELGRHAARGADATALLRALKPSFADVVTAPQGGALHVTGRALPPDAAAATALGPGFVTEAAATAARIAAPDLGGLLACLGPLTSADIRFCTDFGLNVHGKALYVVIRQPTDIQVVSDRNVHDRLVLFTGAAHAAWAARHHAGADPLTVTLEGTPVPLAADGTFAATAVPSASGRVRLVATTATGESTARDLP